MSPQPERLFDLTERIIYLRTIPVGGVLSPGVLRVIARAMVPRAHEEGDLLMQEGQPVLGLHFFTQGGVDLVRNGAQIGHLKAPQTLGFLAILAGGDGTYDARINEPSRTFELDAEMMLELLEDHPEFLRATLRYLAERVLYEIKELSAESLSSRLSADGASPPERPFDFVERILYLRSLKAFEDSSLHSLGLMAEQIEEVRPPAGTPLWAVEDVSNHSLMVAHGSVRCEAEDGRTWLVGPSSVVGGIEAIARQPRWYRAYAGDNLLAFRHSIDDFIDILEDDIGSAQGFIKLFSAVLVGMLEENARSGKATLQVKRKLQKVGNVAVGG